MRHEVTGVTEALISNARNEFLEYGFHSASLRRICAVSGVSTNSVYTRFGGKEGLFDAVVKEAADGLMLVYLESIDRARAADDMHNAMDVGSEGTDIVLDYIYKHKEECVLLFCNSSGTEYENYFDNLAAIEEEYYKEFAKNYSHDGRSIDDFFIHVFCRTGWQYMYELLSHDKSYEEAVEYMKNVRRFIYAGWMAVMEDK